MANKTRTGHAKTSPYQPHPPNYPDGLIDPVVKELCRQTGKNIRYQPYGLEGYFRLLLDGKPFAVISLPNPGTGRVFVKFLNACGRQCAPMKELHNTDVLVSFLRETAG